MAACVLSGPLRVPSQYDPSLKVHLCVHEPIWTTEHSGNNTVIELLSLCAQLDFLCKKELKEASSGRISHGRVSNSFETKAMLIHDELKSVMRKLPSCQQHVEDYLDYSSLARLYPRAAAYITRPSDLSLTLRETETDGYFKKLTQLNQVVVTAQQLNNDVHSQKNHKYMAHEIALLFQACTSLGKNAHCLASTKSAIEKNFSAIKSTLNSSDPPALSELQQKWLLDLTCGVVNNMSSFPPELNHHLLPVLNYLKSN